MIDFITQLQTPQSDYESNDCDHAVTAANSLASAAEAVSVGRLPLVREAYAQLSSNIMGERGAWKCSFSYHFQSHTRVYFLLRLTRFRLSKSVAQTLRNSRASISQPQGGIHCTNVGGCSNAMHDIVMNEVT